MKKIICLALILFGCFSVFAQTERVITEDEFAEVLKKANWQKLPSPYRHECFQELFIESKGDIKLTQKGKSMVESDGKGNLRKVIEFSGQLLSSFKHENYKLESISIKGKDFERKDDGNWTQLSKQTESNKVGFCSGFSSQEYVSDTTDPKRILAKSVEYIYLGSEQINNETADIYARFENYTMVIIGPIVLTNKGWFNQEGAMLKSEVEIQVGNKGNRSITHSIQTWEKLDPHFKITAPILPEAQ